MPATLITKRRRRQARQHDYSQSDAERALSVVNDLEKCDQASGTDLIPGPVHMSERSKRCYFLEPGGRHEITAVGEERLHVCYKYGGFTQKLARLCQLRRRGYIQR